MTIEKKIKKEGKKEEKPKKVIKKPVKKATPKKKAEKKEEKIEIKKEIKTEEPAEKKPVLHPLPIVAKDTVKKPNFLQAIGRRKKSIARVKVFKNGSGKVTVNGKDIKEYFGTDLLVDVALGALINVSQLQKLDISAKVNGGGSHGQAEAIRLGTARALLELNPVFKKNLRKAGYLTRDPRRKERKKPGLRKARRAPQWSKR
ncbi:30S ribosomal protein S9 [Patescibacteria group bacterium]|nr:30S ribosomal protein S9 [Patescibacteria group bacterium]